LECKNGSESRERGKRVYRKRRGIETWKGSTGWVPPSEAGSEVPLFFPSLREERERELVSESEPWGFKPRSGSLALNSSYGTVCSAISLQLSLEVAL